ncbi:MAG: AAA family ATPase [Chloroflexi bacterium]|nr:AAA family ATPase [Chloroflexota bacterium]
MSLLKKATHQLAAAKVGIYGEAGSGKTRTATEIALGLAKLAPSGPAPIAFFDTEGGSDFMIPICEAAGVELLVARARSFEALMQFMAEARAAGAVIIVDSISHTWDDLRESYEKKLRRKQGLEIWDWGVIKPAWREFTNEYLVSPCHAIVCGRSQNMYEQVYNESRGKSEVQVTGTRMKTEKETGYEPSLLIEMDRRPNRDGGTGWLHVATVVKDRADLLDGQEFNDPDFATFQPHFDFLNIGGRHNPTDTTRDSQGMFATPDNAIERKRAVESTIEKIEHAFVLADISSRSAAGKKRGIELLQAHFGSSAWADIKAMRLEDLQRGLEVLRQELGQVEATPFQRFSTRIEQALNDQAALEALRVEIQTGVTADELDGADAQELDTKIVRALEAF